jgi:hypothetical protein
MTGITVAAGLSVLALPAPPAEAQRQAETTTVLVRLSDSQSMVTPHKVPVGPVVFKIVNTGRTARSFAIGGRRTPMIPTGGSATLRFTLSRRGSHEFVSSGRHAERLTGVLDVFIPCTSPRTTTVDVRMDHDRSGIALSQTTIPCGTVTFVVTNIGEMVDSLQVFADYPGARGTTPELKPGQSARLTIRFTEKGVAYYQSGDYIPGEPEFGGSDADGGSFSVA